MLVAGSVIIGRREEGRETDSAASTTGPSKVQVDKRGAKFKRVSSSMNVDLWKIANRNSIGNERGYALIISSSVQD